MHANVPFMKRKAWPWSYECRTQNPRRTVAHSEERRQTGRATWGKSKREGGGGGQAAAKQHCEGRERRGMTKGEGDVERGGASEGKGANAGKLKDE
jgi:hypothetical protein